MISTEKQKKISINMGGHTLDTINISKIYNLRQQKATIKYAAKIPHITSALLMHK